MPIILKDKSEPVVDPGTYLARCYSIVDAGTQVSEMWGEKHKIIITWELPSERIMVDGKDLPRAISGFYTMSLNKKSNLRKDLELWRGRPFTAQELEGFELAKILGTACQLNILHTEHGKAKVVGVAGIPKGTVVPEVQNPKVEYSYSQGADDVFKTLPEWLQKIVSACLEWANQESDTDGEPAAQEPQREDDVPF